MSFSRFLGGFAQAACLIALGTTAWAQQQPLDLTEAQRIAVARSRQLVAQDAAAASVREMSVAAGQLPDPVLRLGIQNVPLSGPDRFSLSRDFMTMRSIGVMQELTWGDKRRLRVERMQRKGERIQAERVVVTANVQRETATTWIERHYAQEMANLIRRQLQEAELEIRGAEIAYGTGRGTRAEIFSARTALVSLQDLLRRTERQARSATLMLARWVGAEAAERPSGNAVDWRQTGASSLVVEEHFRHLPHLAALAAQVQEAETAVRLAQANTRPDWTVEAMYSHRGSAFPDMVSIGVSIPLPVDRANRQDREVAAKVAVAAEARAKYEDAARMHESEVRVMLNDWTVGKERVEHLTSILLPAARSRKEAALTAYRTGQGPLAAVLAARREEIDARMQVLSAEMDTARLWAQLTYLVPDTGALPTTEEQP